MTKTQMVKYLNENYEWFERMQKGLGNDNWWYSNRSPEDCINVKLHAWVDMDDINAKLTDKQKEIIDTLHIDLEQFCNDLVWEQWGMVEAARTYLLNELKEKYHVADLEYGGRSGGWLVVVYSWDFIPDDFDNSDYKYTEIKEYYQTMKNAIAEHERVTDFVLDSKRSLEKAIEDVDNYIDQISEYIDNRLEAEAIQANKVLSLA